MEYSSDLPFFIDGEKSIQDDLPDIPVEDYDSFNNPFEESTSIFRQAIGTDTSIHEESSLNASPDDG